MSRGRPESSGRRYAGDELGLFQHAVRWKHYVARQLAPYLRGNVLEVGAGLGATTQHLLDSRQSSWTCLEPDAGMADALRSRFAGRTERPRVSVIQGTTAILGGGPQFDCVLYIDVLEHIEDDHAELARAAGMLNPGGRILAVSPAHQFLYSPFDRRIGHCRRYSAESLRLATPPALALERTWYLDAAGLLASLGNRLLLSQSMPTMRQVLFWDRRLVAVSAVIDRLLGYTVGKSVAAAWRVAEEVSDRTSRGA